jgi:hypothetical protein
MGAYLDLEGLIGVCVEHSAGRYYDTCSPLVVFEDEPMSLIAEAQTFRQEKGTG